MVFIMPFFRLLVGAVSIVSICFALRSVIGSRFGLVPGSPGAKSICALLSALKGVMMKIKFHVLGGGMTSFHSNKTGKDYRRVRLMGLLEDGAGVQEPATADLGFDGSLPYMPKSGEVCFLDVSEFSTKSAMAEITFSGLEMIPAAKK